MKRTFNLQLLIFVCICVFLCVYWCGEAIESLTVGSSAPTPLVYSRDIALANSREQKKSAKNAEPIFLYRAYYDNRTGPGRARFLAVSHCLTNMKIYIIYDGQQKRVKYTDVEGECPPKWIPSCVWNPLLFESAAFKITDSNKALLSISPGRQVEITLEPLPPLQDKLQVCVPPLYWYDDWPRLVTFIEMWRAQNAVVAFYVNSVSEASQKVLEHYKKLGAIRVTSWPKLPMLNGEDPNKRTYRLAHTLALNDCKLRADSEYVALIDVDEYITSMNGTLLDYVRSKMLHSTYGSLKFPHLELNMAPDMDHTFMGILRTNAYKMKGGREKSVFMPARSLISSTHYIRVHNTGYTKPDVPYEEGALLHNRVAFDVDNRGKKYRRGSVFKKPANWPYTPELYDACKKSVDTIFPDNIPIFNRNVSATFRKCLDGWQEEDGCKDVIGRCYDVMTKVEKWVFYDPTPDSMFTII